jgi:hypothetical protein
MNVLQHHFAVDMAVVACTSRGIGKPQRREGKGLRSLRWVAQLTVHGEIADGKMSVKATDISGWLMACLTAIHVAAEGVGGYVPGPGAWTSRGFTI